MAISLSYPRYLFLPVWIILSTTTGRWGGGGWEVGGRNLHILYSLRARVTDPDPHSGTLEAQYEAVEGRGRSHMRFRGS